MNGPQGKSDFLLGKHDLAYVNGILKNKSIYILEFIRYVKNKFKLKVNWIYIFYLYITIGSMKIKITRNLDATIVNGPTLTNFFITMLLSVWHNALSTHNKTLIFFLWILFIVRLSIWSNKKSSMNNSKYYNKTTFYFIELKMLSQYLNPSHF